ncbi:response regulator [Paenibacillus sp. D2_2]|uniref:response regulator n=1 Tax=Paenibacillus sp. D2_2 TaxID=3073092 RepID=UPI00281659AB|nr:response regulator [Paenibacillus sp. D2_2]WMT39454.1 response regulator [Paenibacillus sp. D2_2]
MYRLLIVDNEEYVVDGLVELFNAENRPDLETQGAYSAAEAMNALMTTSYDIVITDIRMPGINGLELQRIIASRWPYCKVIFLSGYDNFNYAQEAIRQGSVNYILKTEDDDVIIAAVDGAIEKIRSEKEEKKALTEARTQVKKAMAALQREFFEGLLMGEDDLLLTCSSSSRSLTFRCSMTSRYSSSSARLMTGMNSSATTIGHCFYMRCKISRMNTCPCPPCISPSFMNEVRSSG